MRYLLPNGYDEFNHRQGVAEDEYGCVYHCGQDYGCLPAIGSEITEEEADQIIASIE